MSRRRLLRCSAASDRAVRPTASRRITLPAACSRLKRKFRVNGCQKYLMTCVKLVDRIKMAQKDPYGEESHRGTDERTRGKTIEEARTLMGRT